MQTRALRLGLACVACVLSFPAISPMPGPTRCSSCGASGGINRSWVPVQRRSGQSARRGQLRLDPRRRRRRAVRDGSHPWPSEHARRPGSGLADNRADRDPNHPSDAPVLPGTEKCRRVASVHPNRRGNVLQSCVPPSGQTNCERGATPYSPFGPADFFAVDTAGLESAYAAQRRAGSAVPGRRSITYGLRSTVPRPGDRHRRCRRFSDERRTVARRISPRRGEPRDQCDRQRRHSRDASAGGRSSPAQRARTCDYTLMVPCSNGARSDAELDTRTLTDGQHQLVVVAEDAAGNTASTDAIDRRRQHGSGGPGRACSWMARAGRSTNRFDVHWQNPGGQVAPIAAAHWSLCPVAGTSAVAAEGGEGPAVLNVCDALEVPRPAIGICVSGWKTRPATRAASRASAPLRLSLAASGGRDPGVRITVSRRGSRVRVAGSTAVARGRVTVQRRAAGRRADVRVRGAVDGARRSLEPPIAVAGADGATAASQRRRADGRGRLPRGNSASVVQFVEAHPRRAYRAVTARRRVRGSETSAGRRGGSPRAIARLVE